MYADSNEDAFNCTQLRQHGHKSLPLPREQSNLIIFGPVTELVELCRCSIKAKKSSGGWAKPDDNGTRKVIVQVHVIAVSTFILQQNTIHQTN